MCLLVEQKFVNRIDFILDTHSHKKYGPLIWQSYSSEFWPPDTAERHKYQGFGIHNKNCLHPSQ